MTSTPSGGRTPPLRRGYKPRDGRAEGIPLYDQWTYEPHFPLVFQTKDLTYGKAWEVFNTHYLQRGRFGEGALFHIEHYGLWLHLQYLASHGEKFYAADLAANLGCRAKKATDAHTVGKHLDRLENLRLLQRLRNGSSRDRHISVLLHAPLTPTKLHFAGPELMDRVRTNAVDLERKAAGPGRWPTLVWDANTMARHLRGDKDIVAKVQRMQDAIGMVARTVDQVGRYDGADPPFEEMVKAQCAKSKIDFSPKLFLTAMHLRRLNTKPRKEAEL